MQRPVLAAMICVLAALFGAVAAVCVAQDKPEPVRRVVISIGIVVAPADEAKLKADWDALCKSIGATGTWTPGSARAFKAIHPDDPAEKAMRAREQANGLSSGGKVETHIPVSAVGAVSDKLAALLNAPYVRRGSVSLSIGTVTSGTPPTAQP